MIKNILKDMKKTILFATDFNSEETIVSESQKGSNKVNFIERIHRNENELLFDAVATLTKITKSPNFDIAIFKAMDKVCQMIYDKQIENK
jgi:protease II